MRRIRRYLHARLAGDRATIRKPIAYLFVMLPILVVGSLAVAVELLTAYSRLVGIPLKALPNRNAVLIALPALFLWIPIACVLGNIVVWCVPSLRRIAEDYVARTGQPAFLESQKQLLMVLGLFAIILVPLIFSVSWSEREPS
jgi:hypothetical protein